MPELWADPTPPNPPPWWWQDKVVLPVGFTILAFAAWWYGWFDPIIRFLNG